jgi:hypothetical protein
MFPIQTTLIPTHAKGEKLILEAEVVLSEEEEGGDSEKEEGGADDTADNNKGSAADAAANVDDGAENESPNSDPAASHDAAADDILDDNDSGDDDGLEAEIHDAGVDFWDDVKTAMDVYGVDFVAPLPGAPDGWTSPGPPEGWTLDVQPTTRCAIQRGGLQPRTARTKT